MVSDVCKNLINIYKTKHLSLSLCFEINMFRIHSGFWSGHTARNTTRDTQPLKLNHVCIILIYIYIYIYIYICVFCRQVRGHRLVVGWPGRRTGQRNYSSNGPMNHTALCSLLQ